MPKVIISITATEIDVETEDMPWADIPKVLIQTYLACAPQILDGEVYPEDYQLF